MKNPYLTLLLFWIAFMTSMYVQQYQIYKQNIIIAQYDSIFTNYRQLKDSVIVNCFHCNSRNVRYLYPDTIIHLKN